jgi:phosphatidylglycerol---prolipoprotein diacylglyceryl transferase
MLHYPHINPIAFHVGPLKVHWYGLAYLLSFVAAWFLMQYRVKKLKLPITREQVTDLIFYGALGVILGGRLGYVFFYNFVYFLHHPLFLFEVWDGGMSFHGGLLGVIAAVSFWCWRQKKNVFMVTDFVAPIGPIGLFAGRIANFINGELYGRVTTVSWGMVFPNGGPLPRHPSELYEAFFEGILLFVILWWYSAKPKPRMAVSGLFLLLYGCFRFFCEFFRQPDPQLGFVAFGWMTRGMELCVPMILLGGLLLFLAYGKGFRR